MHFVVRRSINQLNMRAGLVLKCNYSQEENPRVSEEDIFECELTVIHTYRVNNNSVMLLCMLCLAQSRDAAHHDIKSGSVANHTSRFAAPKVGAVPNIICLSSPTINYLPHIFLSTHRQYVEYRFKFIAAGFTPLLEAFAINDRCFEKFCCQSGGDIKSKDFEEGICLGDQER